MGLLFVHLCSACWSDCGSLTGSVNALDNSVVWSEVGFSTAELAVDESTTLGTVLAGKSTSCICLTAVDGMLVVLNLDALLLLIL